MVSPGRTVGHSQRIYKTSAEIQQIEIFDDAGAAHPLRVPVSALRLLVEVLAEIGGGNAVSIIPIHAELTTQDAADVPKVSRPFMIQLLERGETPFHKIGTHRRLRYVLSPRSASGASWALNSGLCFYLLPFISGFIIRLPRTKPPAQIMVTTSDPDGRTELTEAPWLQILVRCGCWISA